VSVACPTFSDVSIHAQRSEEPLCSYPHTSRRTILVYIHIHLLHVLALAMGILHPYTSTGNINTFTYVRTYVRVWAVCMCTCIRMYMNVYRLQIARYRHVTGAHTTHLSILTLQSSCNRYAYAHITSVWMRVCLSRDHTPCRLHHLQHLIHSQASFLFCFDWFFHAANAPPPPPLPLNVVLPHAFSSASLLAQEHPFSHSLNSSVLPCANRLAPLRYHPCRRYCVCVCVRVISSRIVSQYILNTHN